MRILWLTMDFDPRKVSGPYRHYYYTLETSIEKLADVVFYGRNEAESDVAKIVHETDPDVVMFYCDRSKWRNVDKVDIPKAYRCSDPWNYPAEKIEWVNKNNIDLVFHLLGAAVPEYQKRVKARCVEMFESVSSELFTNRGLDRVYDVFLTGAIDVPAYPLRNAIYQTYSRKPNCWVRAGSKSLPTVEDYVVKLNQSKVFPTGCCWHPMLGRTDLRFFLNKSLEAMGTETLLLMDVPTCAESLHLVPDHNFVAITMRDFRKKIQYYLKNEEERKQIAQRGRETFLKYHTSVQRAKEVLEHLKRLVE